MTVRTKICGITTRPALDACVQHGAAFVGFMFHAPSPRTITANDAQSLAQALPTSTASVAVMVDPEDAWLDALLADFRPNYLQLHGSESPQRVQELRARTGLPIIKALRIASADDLTAASHYESCADMLLLDAKLPDPNVLGGSGHAFDWSVLDGFAPAQPWFLAGGLTIGNVDDALMRTKARYLDISSGVESAKGVKDTQKIIAFLEKVRAHG